MDIASRTDLLRAAGLVIVEQEFVGDVVEPAVAWRPVLAGDAVPAVCVDDAGDDGSCLDEVDRRWGDEARRTGLFDESGEFLISVAGVGAFELPWARVRLGEKPALSRHLGTSSGEPEFVAISSDGRTVCGVTTEEHGIWIVCAGIS